MIKTNKVDISNYNIYQVAIRDAIRDENIEEVPIEKIYLRYNNHRCLCELEELATKYGITIEQIKQDIVKHQDIIKESLYASMDKLEFEELKDELRQKGQTTPIVLLKGNIVINGNSRLLIMNELCKKDPIKYKNFKVVRCVFLPDDFSADEEDEYEIECQIGKKIEIDYNWYNTGRWMYEYMSEKGCSLKDTCKKFRVKNIEEGRKLINAYNEGIQYLNFIGRPNEFNLIEKHKEALDTIAKCREKIVNEPSKHRLAINLSYAFLSTNNDEKGERLYAHIRKIFKFIENIVEGLSEYNLINSKIKELSSNKNNDKLKIEEEILGIGEISKSEKVLTAFNNVLKTNKKDLISVTNAVLALEEFKESNEKNGAMPEYNLKNALNLISKACVMTDGKIHNVSNIKKYLLEIKEEIEFYEEKLSR